jgi:hypothetical protein
VTNLWHHIVTMDDPAAQRLLALLDGTRDRAALREALSAMEGAPADAAEKLDGMLEKMGRMALLEA